MPEPHHRAILSGSKEPANRATPASGLFASFRVTTAWLLRLPARLLDGAIWVYQRTLSPALVALNPTCGCRFAPTCSHYAREALREHGLFVGVGLTVVRLAKCGPWHPGGEDFVPPRRRPVCTKVSTS